MAEGRWAVILHGGARTIATGEKHANRLGCLTAVETVAGALAGGCRALDAVEMAVRVLERDRTFNAGAGAVANADGVVELDAAVMEGAGLRVGAVGALQGFLHPVSVARKLLDETPSLLVGEGARAFARAKGAEITAPMPKAPTWWSRPRTGSRGADTVGCIVLDTHGGMAVGLSTGGLEGKAPGRVGDSAMPGCGFYVDDRIGGAAFSGDGDAIARTTLAAHVMADLADHSPQGAAELSLDYLARVEGEGGAIVLDTQGRFGCAHNSDDFAVALASSKVRPTAALHQDELRTITGPG